MSLYNQRVESISVLLRSPLMTHPQRYMARGDFFMDTMREQT